MWFVDQNIELVFTDLKKNYNTVQWRQKRWSLQHNIWCRDLDKSKIPGEKDHQNSHIWCRVEWQPSRKRINRNSKIGSQRISIYKEISSSIYMYLCRWMFVWRKHQNRRIGSRKSWLVRIDTKLRGLRDPPSNLSAEDSVLHGRDETVS